MKSILCFIASFQLFASTYLKENVTTFNHELGEVVWVKDEKFPQFRISIYFNQGASLDQKYPAGTTQAALELITAGTPRMKQSEIHDFFDFYGAETGASVTHEFSQWSYSGLIKDIKPLTEKVCELFQSASYPATEVKSHQQKLANRIQNLTSNHSALAERVFRYVLMNKTSFNLPSEGMLDTIKRWRTDHLKDALENLKSSKKRIYILGPKEAKTSLEYLLRCGFKSGPQIERADTVQDKPKPGIYFLPVPNANQAQIRVGTLLSLKETKDQLNLKSLAADFLGGGFTSKLMQELRVKRGLTYSVGAHVSEQASYGRVGIATFTKNETTQETIELILKILKDSSDPQKLAKSDVEHVKKYVKGHFPFTFESLPAFLAELMSLDHRGVGYKSLENFVEEIEDVEREDLAKMIQRLFNPDHLAILVVGNPSIKPQLEKIKPVTIINLKDIL